MLFRIYSILSFILILSSCSSSPYHKEAIELNNKATTLFAKPDSAIILYDKAIALDSSYHIPIQNKINLLVGHRRYPEALETTNYMIRQGEYPEAWQMKGMLADVLQDTTTANFAYKKAIELYDQRINSNQNSFSPHVAKYNKGLTLVLLGDTLIGKKFMQENLNESGQIKATHDSFMNKISNKSQLLDFIL